MKRFLRIGYVVLLLLLILVALVSVRLKRPPRTDDRAELFQGVTYIRHARSTPRPLMVHIVEIDLSVPGIGFLVTPGDPSGGMELVARTTSAFLREFDLQVAVNGSFFGPFDVGTTLWNYYPHSGDPVEVWGLAISNGETYSNDDSDRDDPDRPVLCISPDQVQIRPAGCPLDTTQALAGNRLLVEHGTVTAGEQGQLHPRTAVALDAAGEVMWLIVVDGRQPGYGEGVTLAELADITLELGAETALNLDGGGSSTLVAAGRWGPRLLNAPVHTRIPMRERPVANHLGVYARANP